MTSTAPLNARGEQLLKGSLAVDHAVIPLGTRVQIPNLPSPWDQQVCIADDTGGGIEGKHVDVYCGSGPKAREETVRITGSNQRVCLGWRCGPLQDRFGTGEGWPEQGAKSFWRQELIRIANWRRP